MKPTTRAFISTTFRSTAAVLVGFATKPEVRETFAESIIKLGKLKNQEMVSRPAVDPQMLMIRMAIKNLSEMAELYTVYDLNECSSDYVRQSLETSLVVAAQIGGISVADILNTTKEDGTVPTIVTRIRIALSNSVDREDSPVNKLIQLGDQYVRNISEQTVPEDMEKVFGQNEHYNLGLGGITLAKPYTNDDLPFVK